MGMQDNHHAKAKEISKHQIAGGVLVGSIAGEAKRMLYFMYNNSEAPANNNFTFNAKNVNMSKIYSRIDLADKSTE